MIVYELEVALGRFVNEHSDRIAEAQTTREVLKRVSTGDGVALPDSAKVVVENSYLGEILGLASVAAKGTSNSTAIAHIEKLAAALELFDIRNAISHPNRPFPECYWYRCATIAADPCIDALNFISVSLALQNAESGTLKDPPEDWLHKKRWTVPADIPDDSDFSITGLIGRTRDEAKLAKELRSKRTHLVALVAKGGIGKTSLLQQSAQTLCLSLDAGEFFDAVVWASLKQEALTPEGVQLLTAPTSISEMEVTLKDSLEDLFGTSFDSFSHATHDLSGRRILLCLDNLETILRDSPANFAAFYESLPEIWKVFVTSRIPVDGAKNIPVEPLDHSGALGLARSYLQGRSGRQHSNDLLERIVAGTDFNPLAIKLTADRFLIGESLDEALRRTEQDVLSFSFTNLLDQLSAPANEVLEVVFALESPSRQQLCGVLERSADEVAEAIAQLAKVSLILRQEKDGEEVYVLAGSIRDLLRANPRREEIRRKAAAWSVRNRDWTDSALRHQSGVNASPLSAFYITPNVPAHLIARARELRAALRREDRASVVSIERDLRHRLSTDHQSSFLYRLYAQCVKQLGDLPVAISHFQKAAALDPTDPAPLFNLAAIYLDQGRTEELNQCTTRLLESGWGNAEKSGVTNGSRLWGFHLHSLNVREKYEEVFALTTEWEDEGVQLPMLAIGRASALRRVSGAQHEPSHAEELLGDACLCFFKIILHHGFPRWMLSEFRKLLRELQRRLTSDPGFPHDLRARMRITNTLKLCVGSNAAQAGLDAQSLLEVIQEEEQSSESQKEMRDRLLSEGFTVGRIKSSYKPNLHYFFIQDDNGSDIYVNNSVLDAPNLRKKIRCAVGTEVAVKHELDEARNTYRATRAVIFVK